MDATKKQLDFIHIMEDFVSEKFKGKTKKEASEYISRNIKEYELHINEWATVNGYI